MTRYLGKAQIISQNVDCTGVCIETDGGDILGFHLFFENYVPIPYGRGVIVPKDDMGEYRLDVVVTRNKDSLNIYGEHMTMEDYKRAYSGKTMKFGWNNGEKYVTINVPVLED